MSSIKNVFRLRESKTPQGVVVPHEWPHADILSADRYKRGQLYRSEEGKIPVLATVKASTHVFHATATDGWDVPQPLTWFTFDRRAAEKYDVEVSGDGQFRVLEFELTKDIQPIYFPAYDAPAADDASFWLDVIFKTSFRWVGAARVPEAFKAVAEKHDGLYIAKEDSGFPTLMVSRPSEVLRKVG